VADECAIREPKSSEKPFEISQQEAWEAYERVKANKSAPGADGCSIEEFEPFGKTICTGWSSLALLDIRARIGAGTCSRGAVWDRFNRASESFGLITAQPQSHRRTGYPRQLGDLLFQSACRAPQHDPLPCRHGAGTSALFTTACNSARWSIVSSTDLSNTTTGRNHLKHQESQRTRLQCSVPMSVKSCRPRGEVIRGVSAFGLAPPVRRVATGTA
jgi:hypothetical protein